MNTAAPLIIRIASEETSANSYLLAEENAVLLIDVTEPGKILHLLEKYHWQPEEILLTHEHVDHICGLNALRTAFPGVRVTASAACSSRIGDHRANLSAIYVMLVHAYTGIICPDRHDPFECAPCENTFDETADMIWRGHTLQLKRCPGHSPGSAVILLDHTYLFSGDYLLPEDKINLTLPEGAPDEYAASTQPWLRQTVSAGMLIFPGHGEPYVYSGAANLAEALSQ